MNKYLRKQEMLITPTDVLVSTPFASLQHPPSYIFIIDNKHGEKGTWLSSLPMSLKMIDKINILN